MSKESGWTDGLKLNRPCTPCTHNIGNLSKFKLQTGEVLTVGFGGTEVPAAVGVLHKSDGAFYVCEFHRKAHEEAKDGLFEAMEDFENRVLAADAALRLKG